MTIDHTLSKLRTWFANLSTSWVSFMGTTPAQGATYADYSRCVYDDGVNVIYYMKRGYLAHYQAFKRKSWKCFTWWEKEHLSFSPTALLRLVARANAFPNDLTDEEEVEAAHSLYEKYKVEC